MCKTAKDAKKRKRGKMTKAERKFYGCDTEDCSLPHNGVAHPQEVFAGMT